MRGFIVYPTYKEDSEGAVVQLYGRLENGEAFKADFRRKPYFFIPADATSSKLLENFEVEETDLATMNGQVPVAKVSLKYPQDVSSLRDSLHDAGIPTYEADIRFEYRFLIDNNLQGAVELKGEYEQNDSYGRVYKEPKIKHSEWSEGLVVASLDIETDKKAGALWSVAITTNHNHRYALIANRQATNAECFDDEKKLLERLNEIIHELDPDILLGWNFIDFDMKVLQEKYRSHNVPMNWGRGKQEARLRLESNFMRDSTADVTGRMILDGIQILKNNFVKLDSYTLESASQHYLNSGKIFTGKQRYQDIKDAYDNNPELLVEYNVKDTKLVLDILEESKNLDLYVTRSLLTGMQLDRVRASIASLDNVYLPRLRQRKLVAPTRTFQSRQQITGGYVMESKPGIYDYVIVCDFKSLYPSIMRTLNIDPVSFQPEMELEESSKDYVVAENGAVFSQEPGILPDILEELLAKRQEARKRGDELARYAIKILMNSFFGVLASPNCRFSDLKIGNAITKTGQHIIKESTKLIREEGFDVIYGDTDSIFVDLSTEDEQEAIRLGKQIESKINEHFKKYTQERYQRESKLEMEYEKTYSRFIMPMTRSGEGSKKRYAGLVLEDGKEKMEFVGLEFVRRDWTDIAKELQENLLNLVFEKKDPKDYIKNLVEEVKEGKHDKKLLYRKALRKSLGSYTKTTPPHVKAARLMDQIDSNVIEYYQTVDGPEPAGKVRHSIDYQHYIEKQMQPIADSILHFYGTSFDDVMKGTQQKGLMDF